MATKNKSSVASEPRRVTFKLDAVVGTAEELLKAGDYAVEDYGYMSSYCGGPSKALPGKSEALLICFKGRPTIREVREAIVHEGAVPGKLGDLLALGAVLPSEWRRHGLRILALGSSWDPGGVLPIPKGKTSVEVPRQCPAISVDHRDCMFHPVEFKTRDRSMADTWYLALSQPKG